MKIILQIYDHSFNFITRISDIFCFLFKSVSFSHLQVLGNVKIGGCYCENVMFLKSIMNYTHIYIYIDIYIDWTKNTNKVLCKYGVPIEHNFLNYLSQKKIMFMQFVLIYIV